MSAITGKQIVALNRVFTDGDTMSSQQMQNLIDSGLLADLRDANVDKINRSDFRKFCGLGPISADEFPTFLNGTVGLHKSSDAYRKAMKVAGINIGDWANDIMDKPQFVCASEKDEFEYVAVSNAELGFKDGTAYRNTRAKAKDMGFEDCQPEDGPVIRLAYKNQPKGEWLVIGMEPIADSHGCLSVFDVDHDDDGLWLYAFFGNPDRVFSGDFRFVFRRRKAPKA